MALRNLWLSRLLGSESEETKEEDTSSTQAAPEKESPPKEPSRHTLELQPEHSLNKLWEIRNNQVGGLSEPMLCLEGPSDSPMPDDVAKKELFRLLMTVNASANGRLKDFEEKSEESSETPDLDAEVTVFIAQDELTAWILIYPPTGAGQELSQVLLREALEEYKICYGVDDALLDRLPQDPKRYFRLFPVARGIPAVHGIDGRIVDFFPRTDERKPTLEKNDRMDYTNLDFVHNVEAGGEICRIIAPTDGTPGRTVKNEEITPINGWPAEIPQGRNTLISEDGGTLVAAIAGHVTFSGKSFQVKPVLNITGNVDYSVGNINFFGDVHIRGDVCSGFTVRAAGNIIVDGVVEACSVEAGRDLILSSGIQGNGQAVIRAQRNLYAKYLENSCVYAKSRLKADCIINCDVYCDGSVTVRSGHGSIIGGKIRAASGVNADVIGTRREVRTDIVLGGQPCEQFDYDMLLREIKNLEDEVAKVEQQPDSPDRTAQLSKLQIRLVMNRGKQNMIQKEKEQEKALEEAEKAKKAQEAKEAADAQHIEEAKETADTQDTEEATDAADNQDTEGAKETADAQDTEREKENNVCRLVCNTVYPGTVLKINGVPHRFTAKTSPCSAILSGNEIRLN